jgi:hypothetical protein
MAQSNFVVKNGLVVLNGLTATSTSTITGAAVVYGGLGVTENINIGGRSAFTGTVTAFGSVNVLSTLTVGNQTNSTSTTTGALIVDGGLAVVQDVFVGGNIHAVGNITADGNIQLGNQTGTDTLYIGAEVVSDILPKTANLYKLGNGTNYWNDLYSNNANILSTATLQDLAVNGIAKVNGYDIMSYDGSVHYVSDSIGSDSNDGHRHISAFKTIKYALSQAQDGDTVYIEPGTYTEDFPVTIPTGVHVKGAGLRAVFVQPTTATNTQTAFLINGGATISDFTVGNFYKPGYAFKYASTVTTVLRSAYIERFTVLTRGSVRTTSDPYGYDSNDAGGGIYADGANVTTDSIQPALLVNEATFITPGATAIYLTNGVKLEALNTFAYFADKAFHGESGTLGWGGVGRTRLKVANNTGTYVVGHNLYYIGSTGTVLASGVIDEVDNDYLYLQGKASGFEEAADRPGKIVNVYGNTTISSFQRKYGTGSAQFTTAGDLLEVVNNTDIQFETSPYTLEAFIYLEDSGRIRQIFDKGSVASTEFGLWVSAANRLTGRHGTAIFTGTTSISTGTWHHVAMSRDASNNNRIFYNGLLEATTSSVANVTNGDSLTIGGDGLDPSKYLKGYIDEVRVSSVNRYTTTFTPPIKSFDSDASTVLLLHCDGGDGGTVFSDDGLGTQNIYSTTATYTATVVASSKQITLADYRQFGAELRSIGSAAVYGNYGAYGDGEGIDFKLIAFNMGYIGSGKDLSNDPTLAIQAQEIIELNRAKIYYQTVDHIGDFRVGDQFRINQRTGNVDFGTANFKLGPIQSLTISDGVNAAILQPTSIQVGSLLFAAGTIGTISGNLTLNPSGSLTLIESDLQVNGNLTFTGDLAVTSITTSGSTTTGAVVVGGGVGIGQELHVGGDIYSNGLRVYAPKVSISLTPPTTATNNIGDFWIDPSIGVEYQWVQDGSNFYWIQFTGV